ncbi:TonB-dependent receptor [soil metagenome]
MQPCTKTQVYLKRILLLIGITHFAAPALWRMFRMKNVCRISVVFSLFTLWAVIAHAQTTATLTGTIKDPQGAVLPGASITVHSVATGADRATLSDSVGDYLVPSLQPGEYTVQVKMEGFALYTVKSLVLQVDQRAALPITLALASAGETVQVEGTAPLIDAASITVGQVIDKQTVQEIPLNGRHFLDLTVLTPGGVTAPANGNLTSPSRGVGAFSFLTAGNRDDSVNFQINGINLNDISNAQIVFQPSINTTSEVKINNSTFSAEYGRNSGSIVNVSTRSGSNKFHGEVFDYVRNNSFDARNWFNPKGTAQNSLKRNNFGVALGGPLWRNKTFFFASYEGLRQRQGLQTTATVPSAADRNGTTNAVSKALLALMPSATSGANTFSGSANGPVTIDQGTIDLQHISGEKDTVHAFYAYQNDVRTEPTTQGNTVPGFGDHRPGYRQIGTLNETHVFSPRLVNEARLGFNRVFVSFLENYEQTGATLGMNNFPAGVTPAAGIPFTTISGFTVAIGGPSGFPSGRYDTLGVVSDTATYTAGKHSVKFGGEARRYLNANFSADAGTLGFAATPTILSPTGATIQTAKTAIQNFQQGLATSFSITPTPTTSRIYGNALGAFVMDNFKLTNRFMIEAGFRFEWFGTPTFGNAKAVIFDAAAVTLNQIGTNGYNSPYKQNFNYQPRLGFSYDVFGNSKTVLRGAFGYMVDQPLSGLVTGLSNNPPYTARVSFTAASGSTTLTNTATTTNLPAISVSNLYAAASATAISVSAVQPNYKNAYTETFNLNVQTELRWHVGLTAGFYGSVGKHLRSSQNINQIFPATNARAFTKISASSPIAPNAALNANVTQTSSNGISNYNAFWLNARKNAGRGLQFGLTWQYSKSMDLGSTAGTSFTDITQPRLNYALSDFDLRHRISGNGIYALPFKGNRLVEGFRVAGIVQWQTGNPLNITTTSTYTGTASVQHPNLIGAIPYAKQYTASGTVNWFANPGGSVCATATAGCTFQLPSTGFGSMGRNAARGPGFADVDASLYKDTKLFEGLTFQLRLDVFDVFNHPSFSNPGTSATVGSASFGVITATRFPVGDLGSSRQLQIAGKFVF